MGEDAAKLGDCAWLSCDGAATRLGCCTCPTGAWLSCGGYATGLGYACTTGAWLSCGGDTAGLGCCSWYACATGAWPPCTRSAANSSGVPAMVEGTRLSAWLSWACRVIS